MSKRTLTISRHWHRPEITTTVSVEGISMNIDLDDFITALKEEIGSITMVFTQKKFELKVDNAVEAALQKIKEESIKAV